MNITFKGDWLADAGFETGTLLEVRVMAGCLVLTAQELPPEEPEIMKTLKQACKLRPVSSYRLWSSLR